MAYVILKTNGQTLTTINDGSLDTTHTSVNLPGRNYNGYGAKVAENFVHMLENFANGSAPSTPLKGQLWYDSNNSLLKFYDGTQWKINTGTTASINSSPPTSPVAGDLWWVTDLRQLKGWNGASWTTIGPTAPQGSGVSGQIVANIIDTLGNTHVVVQEWDNDVLLAIWSKDSQFTPNVAITGFANIRPGLNSNTSVTKFNGTATNSEAFGNLATTDFLRANTTATTSGNVSFLTNNGITIGASSTLKLLISNTQANITNAIANGNISFQTTISGNVTEIFRLDGSTQRLVLASNPTNTFDAATKGYVDSAVGNTTVSLARDGSNTITGNILPNVDLAVTFGNASRRFTNVFSNTFTTNALSAISSNIDITGVLIPTANITYDLGSSTRFYKNAYIANVFGTASSALYADLAERYDSDVQYPSGTVLVFGGPKEVTISTREADTRLAGVVSDKPAYLMNSGLFNGVPIALRGRVYCRVTGNITKGDMLTSSSIPGVATRTETFIGGAIIGKSLVTVDLGSNVSLIEIVVGTC